jgi:hypothetical protein
VGYLGLKRFDPVPRLLRHLDEVRQVLQHPLQGDVETLAQVGQSLAQFLQHVAQLRFELP